MVVLYVIMFVVQWKIIAKKRYMIQLQNDIFHNKLEHTHFYQNQNVTKNNSNSSFYLFMFLDFSLLVSLSAWMANLWHKKSNKVTKRWSKCCIEMEDRFKAGLLLQSKDI